MKRKFKVGDIVQIVWKFSPTRPAPQTGALGTVIKIHKDARQTYKTKLIYYVMTDINSANEWWAEEDIEFVAGE